MGFFSSISSISPLASAAGTLLGGGSSDEVITALDPWDITGTQAGLAAEDAAAQQAAAQQAALDYYIKSNETAQGFREGGLTQLGALAGFDSSGAYTGDFSAQQALIDQAKSSPIYQSQLAQGSEALARNANATGGLRQGGTVSDISNFESNLLNQAYNQQLGGIQDLAQLPSASAQTAQLMAAPGTTLAQGTIAGQQAQTTATGNVIGGLGSLFGGFVASDKRLKENINKISDTSHPEINLYEWDWRPESGKEGYETGFIAQEVEEVWPDLVETGKDGIKRIYKEKIEERLNGSFNG